MSNVSTGSVPHSPFRGAAVSLHGAMTVKQLEGEQRAAAEELRRHTHRLKKDAIPVGYLLQRSAALNFEAGATWYPRGTVFDCSAVSAILRDYEFLPVYRDEDWQPLDKMRPDKNA